MSTRFSVAIVISLVILMALSFLPVHGEQEVYDTVVRLHVLANSDSEEDQALKLKVRDAVLEVTSPLVAGCATQAEAVEVLNTHLADLEAAAKKVIEATGRSDTVTVLLGEEDYPTRTYESCAFPAGRYVSLRVCIGAAEGQNWWCCLFPPLCLSAATAKEDNEDAFIQVGLTKDQYGIITETGKTKYKVRFKVLEVLEDWFG
ncbi:MAG: stage II sporulation protein R [Ruminococcaceae bacterium]|nr:stage II sporulation protein R [Oscillospiraceae bacterium]